LNDNFEKIHLGCGDKYIDGFVHIDLLDLDHIDYVADARDLSFIPDDSAKLLYASHVLEHFGREELLPLLIEWHRVIKADGILRIAVPDFKAVVEVYKHDPSYQLSDLIGLVCGGQKNEFDFHKTIFDEQYLTTFLKKVGFKKVSKWDWRDTEHSHVDDYSQAYLPHMDKENGNLMSLNLQAHK
tara:strand:- start:323 stop:874 length:552 start_codon:yes stop_codon:yes gene_type:complete